MSFNQDMIKKMLFGKENSHF